MLMIDEQKDNCGSFRPTIGKPHVVCRFFARLWHCKFLWFHDWTSAAQQGIPPTPEQLKAGIAGFNSYATMYCKRCGHISKLSNRLKCK
jgi:hypothetical protein